MEEMLGKNTGYLSFEHRNRREEEHPWTKEKGQRR